MSTDSRLTDDARSGVYVDRRFTADITCVLPVLIISNPVQSPAAAAAMWIYTWDTRAVFSLSLSYSRILSTRNVSALKTVCCFKTVVETILAVLILILFLEGSVFKTVKKSELVIFSYQRIHCYEALHFATGGSAYLTLLVPLNDLLPGASRPRRAKKIVMRCTNVSYLSWMWSVDSALLIKANCG